VNIPRILIAGLRGGSGKTLVSTGLLAAWRKRGRSLAPFKKGPDYIDAAWLGLAAGRPCRNLDLFLMSPQAILASLAGSIGQADMAVIEGNRGLFDGMDARGTCSTAELAKLLRVPVILTIDCSKVTRTVAALVLGCQHLDPEVPIRGVVLNQTAGSRHERVLREAIEQSCALPVLGAIPRLREDPFPERHLGLVPPQEHDRRAHALERVAAVAERYLDLETIWALAGQAPTVEAQSSEPPVRLIARAGGVRIGVFRDEAFQFYYPENLEALTREGASLVEISPLGDATLPPLDALYIGGGFPETLAPRLAVKREFADSLCHRIAQGLPVYAECGGAVYLGEKLLFQGQEYRMAGALPVAFSFQSKPQGHGYAVLETVAQNPFFAVGEHLRGHEFHYTYMQSFARPELNFAFRVLRGHGFDGHNDGLCYRNVLASYTHVHALGAASWAPCLVRAAERFASRA